MYRVVDPSDMQALEDMGVHVVNLEQVPDYSIREQVDAPHRPAPQGTWEVTPMKDPQKVIRDLDENVRPGTALYRARYHDLGCQVAHLKKTNEAVFLKAIGGNRGEEVDGSGIYPQWLNHRNMVGFNPLVGWHHLTGVERTMYLCRPRVWFLKIAYYDWQSVIDGSLRETRKDDNLRVWLVDPENQRPGLPSDQWKNPDWGADGEPYQSWPSKVIKVGKLATSIDEGAYDLQVKQIRKYNSQFIIDDDRKEAAQRQLLMPEYLADKDEDF